MNLKNRFGDQVLRYIRRHLRFEIGAVDDVQWHKEPDDKKFNTVTVIMRDRRQKTSANKEYYREQLPCLQSFIGHHLGQNWNPRKGDLVRVWFYQERKGIVLGTTWSWAQKPVCRKSPYDIVNKGGQWIKPYQDPATGDFIKQPYPESKKPYCFKWFHGSEGPDGKPSGNIGPGRDWLWLFDFCHEGDSCPDCRNCKDIDCVERRNNHGFKFYSEQTESKKAFPLRGLYFTPGGSYWMFESRDEGLEGCVSELFTAGKGFWAIQGAKSVTDLKGHLRHYPNGTMEVHSATNNPDDNLGSRVKLYSPSDTTADGEGLIAADLHHLESGALVRIYKDGKIQVSSANDPSGDTIGSQLYLDPEGHCWVWNKLADAYLEIFSDGSLKIKGEPITLDALVTEVTGDLNVDGACHCGCSQDLTTFTETDPGNKLTVSKSTCSGSGIPANQSCYICIDCGVGYLDDCDIKFDLNVSVCNSGSGCGCCGLTNDNSDDLLGALLKKLIVEVHGSTPTLSLSLYNGQTRVVHSDYTIALNTPYYCELKRVAGATTATLNLYSDSSRKVLLTTLSITNSGLTDKYRYLYSLSSMNNGTSPTISASVANVNLISNTKRSVPPLTAEANKFLGADGIWGVPSAGVPSAHASSHKGGGSDAIDVATTSVNGLESSADKTKLNGIASGADVTGSNTPQNHAARHVTGGGDTIADVVAAGNSGLMSGADKTKINGIASGADVTASNNPKAHAASHVTGSTDVIASVVAAGNAGLMTGADKTKLDGIASGANVTATALAPAIHAATDKATPVDDDQFGIADSASSYVIKSLTFGNLKTTLRTAFDPVYPLLLGKAGGQVLYGGTGSGDNLQLLSTSHATKGKILIGTLSAYNQVNGRLGINIVSPLHTLDINGDAYINGDFDVVHSNTEFKFGTYLLDIGVLGLPGGWARSIRIVNAVGSNGQDGGAFGAYGTGTTPTYIYMAIPTSDPVGYDSTKILKLSNDGNVWMGNNCSALSFTDRTKAYTGKSALEEIRKIASDEMGNIDHDTLPEFAVTTRKEISKDGPEIVVKERNLGNMVSILTVGLQELDTDVTTLKELVKKLTRG